MEPQTSKMVRGLVYQWYTKFHVLSWKILSYESSSAVILLFRPSHPQTIAPAVILQHMQHMQRAECVVLVYEFTWHG